MSLLRLRPDVSVRVEYRDETAFGSAFGARADEATVQLCAPLIDHLRAHGTARMAEIAPGFLRSIVDSPAFGEIATPDGLGAWRIRPDLLFPRPGLSGPRALWLERADAGGQVRANLPPQYWPGAHELISSLAGRGYSPEGAPNTQMQSLLAAMQREDLLEGADDAELADLRGQCVSELSVIGHNTVVVRSADRQVLVDPFLFPHTSRYPQDYQPVRLAELGVLDAVLITHSHPDHFDLGSLLQIPSATRMIVPYVERESLLAVDMSARLAELGFDRITVLEWGQSTSVGDIEVHALPFYGEQPTDGEVLHPTVRNVGNTYLVRTPSLSAVFLADSGRDGQGDVKQVAARARARLGAVDIVFAGYRGWLAYPSQHLLTTVARFLLFVPPWLWGVRQRIMTDADEALDVAERWQARYVAGYADGGAPWFWESGLGPRLDDEAPSELSAFDPYPESLLNRASARSQSGDGTPIASPVRPLLLRPGDSLRGLSGTPEVVRVAGHRWPYADHVS